MTCSLLYSVRVAACSHRRGARLRQVAHEALVLPRRRDSARQVGPRPSPPLSAPAAAPRCGAAAGCHASTRLVRMRRVLACTTPRSFGLNSDSLCAKACMLNVCTSMNTRVHTRIVSRSHARARRRATRETNSYSFSRGSEHGNRQFETSSSRLSRHRSKRIC